MKIVENRHEMLFIYDASYCNPNGDPADENKPRTDPETGINLVTDVRLKRTIRDYLYDLERQTIFVKVEPDEAGIIPDAKARAKEFLDAADAKGTLEEQKRSIDNKVLSECIDIRLFGAVIPFGKKDQKNSKSITHTGPVQFQIGRSFHKVSVERIKGTGAFASTSGKGQQTFRTEYIVPYSLIHFYGVVNEVRAKETKLTEEDLGLLYKGMWLGTKNMITRSKLGLTPRVLFIIRYKPGYFQMSDLDKKLVLKSEKTDLELRNTEDYVLDATALINALQENKEKIEKILLQDDYSLKFTTNNSEPSTLTALLEPLGIPIEHLQLE